MDVQSSSSQDLFEGLPPLIGLPRCMPARPEYRRTPFPEVCVPDELPPYLLLGSLDRDSFHSEDAGWTARWIGAAPDTFVEAKYERASRRLELRQVWRGIDGGMSYTTGDDVGRGVQMLYMPFPAIWDKAAAERLEAAYRLKYWPAEPEQYGFAGIPDGGFKTIGVPVPVTRLAAIKDCFERLGRDSELAVPTSGRLELRFGTINHVTGKGPAWTEDPMQLYLASFNANGLVPLGLPQLEHGRDGSSAWTVRRFVYLALITVPFAGLEFVIERLAEHGLIRRTDDAMLEPGLEFDAFVGPAALDFQCQSLAWMDAQGARRVYYLLNSDEERAKGAVDRMALGTDQSVVEVRELIRQAALVSVRQRRWLSGAIGRERAAS